MKELQKCKDLLREWRFVWSSNCLLHDNKWSGQAEKKTEKYKQNIQVKEKMKTKEIYIAVCNLFNTYYLNFGENNCVFKYKQNL